MTLPAPLLALKGSQLVDVTVEGHQWAFTFDTGDYIVAECVWRLLADERIVLTDEDNGQMFGLQEPVDACDVVKRKVGASSVSDVSLRAVSSDLTIKFVNETTLEVISNSGGYENWHFFGRDGSEVRALGGGTLQR